MCVSVSNQIENKTDIQKKAKRNQYLRKGNKKRFIRRKSDEYEKITNKKRNHIEYTQIYIYKKKIRIKKKI